MKLTQLFVMGLLFTVFSAAQAGDIYIYEAGHFDPTSGLGSKGHLVLANGQKAGVNIRKYLVTDDAKATNRNLAVVRDFFKREFSRDSYDGKGSIIEATVKVGRSFLSLTRLFDLHQNAAWVPSKKRFIFGAGDKEMLSNFTRALDVIGHEYTHAIIDSSSALTYAGQTGALNEHLADVFGQYIQVKMKLGHDDFLIGETVLNQPFKNLIAKEFGSAPKALRNMLNPELSFPPQPKEMQEIPSEFGTSCEPTELNDQCGVHSLSGIPNRAMSLVIQKLGWDKVAHVLYVVMTERLPSNAEFSTYASETMAECGRQLSTTDCAVFDDAFKAVGL